MNIVMTEDDSTKKQQSSTEDGEKFDSVCARHQKYSVHVQKRQKLVGDVAESLSLNSEWLAFSRETHTIRMYQGNSDAVQWREETTKRNNKIHYCIIGRRVGELEKRG